MVSSRLSNLLDNCIVERKHTLYYAKYLYKVSFTVIGAGKTNYIYTIDELRNRLIRNIKTPTQTRYSPDSSIRQALREIENPRLDSMLAIKRKYHNLDDYTLRAHFNVSYYTDSVRVYTNNLSAIDEMLLENFANLELHRVEIDNKLHDTKYFITPPKHKYRMYFKHRTITSSFRDELTAFFAMYPQIVPSQSLKWWLENSMAWRRHTLRNSYSVDYDNESDLTVLHLYFDSSLFGKIYKLEQKTVDEQNDK